MKINSTAGCESNELGKLTTAAFSQLFVEEVGGTPDLDYFTREVNTSE